MYFTNYLVNTKKLKRVGVGSVRHFGLPNPRSPSGTNFMA